MLRNIVFFRQTIYIKLANRCQVEKEQSHKNMIIHLSNQR